MTAFHIVNQYLEERNTSSGSTAAILECDTKIDNFKKDAGLMYGFCLGLNIINTNIYK
jgi:hypothetical protein